MAVNNRIAPATQTAEEKGSALAAVYEANGMEVKLTPALVRDYLVSGNKEDVSFQEIAMFINLCKFNGLNPWLKEAHCIKYGNSPATMVVGKSAFEKRAESHPAFDGCTAGIITIDDQTGEIDYKCGCFRFPGEKIIGGWAEVWRKDRSHSTRIEVPFDEYAGRKKDGSLNSQWADKPGTMIRKVALVQALREAFPSNLGGMYAAEEQGHAEPEATAEIIQPEPEALIEEKTESSENTTTAADVAQTLFDN